MDTEAGFEENLQTSWLFFSFARTSTTAESLIEIQLSCLNNSSQIVQVYTVLKGVVPCHLCLPRKLINLVIHTLWLGECTCAARGTVPFVPQICYLPWSSPLLPSNLDISNLLWTTSFSGLFSAKGKVAEKSPGNEVVFWVIISKRHLMRQKFVNHSMWSKSNCTGLAISNL